MSTRTRPTRNVAGWGGGGLLDIGWYLVHTARFQSFQRVQIAGTRGRIEVEIPFNARVDRPCRLAIGRTGDLNGAGVEWIELDVCNQFTAQAEAFAHAILDGGPQPVPLEDAVANMRCLDAIARSSASGRWEPPA